MERDLIKGIGKIPYKKDAKPDETLVFKEYNAEEIVHGRKMEDWLRFSVCYWHTFRGTGADPFGAMTLKRPWDDGSNSLANAERRLKVAFEFMSKLGVKFYTFHDTDVAPSGDTLEEANQNLDKITDLALKLQSSTGIQPLWITCNLFAHPRYMNGASSNPDAHVVAYAASQVKKGLDIAKKLGAKNFVFWNGRDGFQTLLNTKVYAELSHMASFLRMAVDYKEKIGFTGQFLIEPKPKEPTKHQYDYDSMTVIGFLRTFELFDHFKINVEPNHTTLAGHCHEHDVVFASAFGMLGSVDANTGSPDLGWDTDQFPMDIKQCTLIMKTVIQQGGLQPGGLNFDAKLRRESTDIADMFIAHIGAMDSYARGLRNAARIIEDGLLDKHIKERYSSFESGIGLKIDNSSCSLEECEEYIRQNGEPTMKSGKQEHLESLLNHYI
jgi:xylose isomerase